MIITFKHVYIRIHTYAFCLYPKHEVFYLLRNTQNVCEIYRIAGKLALSATRPTAKDAHQRVWSMVAMRDQIVCYIWWQRRDCIGVVTLNFVYLNVFCTRTHGYIYLSQVVVSLSKKLYVSDIRVISSMICTCTVLLKILNQTCFIHCFENISRVGKRSSKSRKKYIFFFSPEIPLCRRHCLVCLLYSP